MVRRTRRTPWRGRIVYGLVAGATLVVLDNIAFGGEISPVVILTVLIAATIIPGLRWGGGGWLTSLLAWVGLPLAHVIKHALGLPDTLHPDTYLSIGYLAGFTLAVTIAATFAGAIVHRIRHGGSSSRRLRG